MGSSATPFFPPTSGGGQIGAFPTFPAGAPLFADDDGLVAVAAFPPLAAFGFGTFCPPEDQQQQQQLLVPGDQHQQQQHHQFVPLPSPFLGDTALSRFTVDETQMLMNMACGGDSFFSDSCAELQRHNIFPSATVVVPNSEDPLIFGGTDCAAGIGPRPTAVTKSELLNKIEQIEAEQQCTTTLLVAHQQPQHTATVRRGGTQSTQRGGMRRRTTERMGKRKTAQNANNLLAVTQQSFSSLEIDNAPPPVVGGDESAKEEMERTPQPQQLQRQLLDSTPFAIDSLKLNEVSVPSPAAPNASPPGYRMPAATVAQEEPKCCANCGGNIYDQIMLALGTKTRAFFHCECLKCDECANPLEKELRCYVRNNRIYCDDCYAKNFGMCCAMCDRIIGQRVWARRSREFFYHLTCFKCEHCNRQLGTEDRYALDDLHRAPPAIPRLLCELHYKELVLGENCSSKQKTKRVRTTFADEQLNILHQHFKVDSNPDGADLERIAYLTGLSKRVTQVWFQNSRARQKKHCGHVQSRKSAVAGVSGGGDATGGSSSATSVASGAGVDTPCLGGCRSATLTPSSVSNGGAGTSGQSPVFFGGGTSSEVEGGFRQLLTGPISSSPITRC